MPIRTLRIWAARAALAISIIVGPAANAAILDSSFTDRLAKAESMLLAGNIGLAKAQAELLLLTRPLKVVLPSGSEADEDVAAGFKSAASIWSSALDGQLRFEFVNPGEATDITVRAAASLQRGGQQLGGNIRWVRELLQTGRTYDYAITGSIYVRTESPDGDRISRDALQQIALHELGHLLGLGDSDEQDGVMKSLNLRRPIAAPNSAEIAAVLDARERAWSLRDQCELQATLGQQLGASRPPL